MNASNSQWPSVANGVGWFALLARDFKEALSASDPALTLAPTDLYVETNTALWTVMTREILRYGL
jgi:lipoprotein NlpI